jgi:hypothetical protein
MAKHTCVNGHVTKDDKALKCSQCGADLPPVPKRSRLLLILGILGALVLCGVVVISSGGNKGSGTANAPVATQAQAAPQAQPVSETAAAEQPTQAAKSTNTPKPQPSPTPAPAIGSDVSVGKIGWKVTKAAAVGNTLKSDNQFVQDKTTSGMFVQVTYQIENRGTDKVYFQAPKLVDAQNRKFGDYSEGLFFIPQNEQCVLKELNPNVPAACTAIYEVAADAKQLKAEVTPLALLGGSLVLIDLAINSQ